MGHLGLDSTFDTETRKCKDCDHSKHVANGWICEKLLMGITPNMYVVYKVLKGTCFKSQE